MKRSLMVEGRASRWGGCSPQRTGTTPRCWPPRWTNSARSARSRKTSPSTSTPGTTRRRPATNSRATAWPATSPIRATRLPSRPGSAGTWSGPTPGTTTSTGCGAATSVRGRHRRVLRPRRRDHHAPQAHPRGMDPLPMGRPPGQATMTTHVVLVIQRRPTRCRKAV